MKTKLLIIIAIILMGINCSIWAAPAKTIVFAMEATYPPFEAVKPSGEIYGFDVAVAQALCNETKATCKFVNHPFDSLILGLKLGKFDAIISAMAITEARQQQINFTTAYYTNAAAFVAATNKSLTISAAGLKNKTIGAQNGSTFANYLEKKYGKAIKIKTYASIESAFLDLTADRIDAVFVDQPIITQWLKQVSKNHYAIVGELVNDKDFFGQGNGIAVSKTNPALLNELNAALAKIKANGQLQKIAQQYFGT